MPLRHLPSDPRIIAELALCRRRWLSLPIATRRRHWQEAASQLGTLSAIAGWVELRAWELAGIHRWQARQLTANPFAAADLVERIGKLLERDPLEDRTQDSARGAQEPSGGLDSRSVDGNDV